jgi:hypothetical protein
VTDAINLANEGILELATTRGVMVIDVKPITEEILRRVNEEGYLVVGGEHINLMEKGNNPYFATLNDTSGHVGTVVSGLVANLMFVEPLNDAYGLGIAPLTEEEILQNAGIH